MLGFRKVDFRNSKYQGLISSSYSPHGEGILLDDQLRFILSSWHQGALDGNTLVFDSHSKYIYGSWRNGVPQGVNVYRGGDTILLANFSEGTIDGQFLVIFETEGIMITVQIDRGRAVIISKTKDIKQQDILQAANEIGLIEDISKLGSLIGFIKSIHKSNISGIDISTSNNLQFVGINDGLGILFDDNNFIHKVGVFEEKREIVGIGGVYGVDQAHEGDFENHALVTYEGERPREELKEILREAHLKSITFVNSYIVTKVPEILTYLNGILREEVMGLLSEENLPDEIRFNMNDSLDYHPRDESQNQRLKMMRAELYLSIGRPGSEIKPIPKPIIDEFIMTEEKQKRHKKQGGGSSKYTSFAKKSSYDYVDIEDREPTARFEELNYRQTSPVRNKHLASLRYTNAPKSPTKTIDREEVAMWKEESQRIIEARKSRTPSRVDISNPRISPFGSTIQNSSYLPKTSLNYSGSINQTASIIPTPAAITSVHNPHPTASVVPTSLALSRSRNTNPNLNPTATLTKPPATTIANIKYQDIKERRARLLNQYKQIGNRSSPMRVSPFKQSPRNPSPRPLSPSKLSMGKNSENTMYGSPYNDMKSSKADIRHSRKQSTDIKTISRRMDKSQFLPARSPGKYSYLNPYM